MSSLTFPNWRRAVQICLHVLAVCVGSSAVAMGKTVKEIYPSDFFQGAQLQLAEAIDAKDVQTVKRLARQTDLNTPARKGITVLFFAYTQAVTKRDPKRFEIITELVKAGADAVDYEAKDMGSVWGAALHRPEPEFVRALLDGGVSPDAPGQGKGTHPALFEASNETTPLVMQLLIERGANVNAKNRLGKSVLAHTLSGLQLDQTEYLLKAGASPVGVNQLGVSFGWALQTVLTGADKSHAGYKKLLEIQTLAQKKGMKWPPDAPEVERDRMRARGETPVVPAGQSK